MLLKTNIKEAVRSLYSSKQRTLLALVGIVIGIGSVIALVTVGQIVANEALKQFKELGTDLLTIQKDYSGQDEEERSAGGKKETEFLEAMAIVNNCRSIAVVAPTVEDFAELQYGGRQAASPQVIGVTESFAGLNKLKLKEGRFVSDLDKDRYFCVLGSNTYQSLGKSGLKKIIGSKVGFWDTFFTVIGVLDSVQTGMMRPYSFDDSVFIPITTLIRMKSAPKVRTISARMRPGASHIRAREEVDAYYSRLNRPAVRVQSAKELIEQQAKQMRLFTLLLGTIGSISLIVGGVGVMNVMLVSVSERKKEIGIRRALGARRKDIQGQFLIESLILSIIGGMLGVVLGVSAAFALAYFNKWTFMVSYFAIFIGVGVASVIGLFFGFYPARAAAKLDPIAALRGE